MEPFIGGVGNFKEPFSLDQLISDNALFVEPSRLDAVAPARDFGAPVGGHDERLPAVAGTLRVTYAPILAEDEVSHFGLAGSYRSRDPARATRSCDSTFAPIPPP